MATYRASIDVNAGISADVDAAVAAQKGLTLLGYSCRESAGSPAVAAFNIVHGEDADDATKLVAVELAANASETRNLPPIACDGGLSIEVLAGTVDVFLYYRIDA